MDIVKEVKVKSVITDKTRITAEVKKSEERVVDEKRKNEGAAYRDKLEIIRLLDAYVTNIVNARYFTARCNMMSEQINKKEIVERVDDKIKSEEFLEAEYYLTKARAYRAHRDAYLTVCDLKKLGVTDKEIDAKAKDQLDGPIVRNSYDESFKGASKACFVPSDKD